MPNSIGAAKLPLSGSQFSQQRKFLKILKGKLLKKKTLTRSLQLTQESAPVEPFVVIGFFRPLWRILELTPGLGVALVGDEDAR